MKSKKKVVVIGGGHGQSLICRGIKNISNIGISAIVTVADDGGSTGRLRRQFNIPAMGDIRNVLISLAESESLLSTLMDYRFTSHEVVEESDVQGHNLGNLILTALTDTCGSFMEAISRVEKVLSVKGKIIPSTLDVITLYAIMADGTIVKGEDNIPRFNNRISRVYYKDRVIPTPLAVKAIEEADLIIYGIGSLYTSIIPNIIIDGIDRALKNTRAQKVYFCNVMSQPGETDDFSLEDHVDALIRHGALVDKVIMASDKIPEALIEKYRLEKSSPIRLVRDNHPYEIIKSPLLDFSNNVIRHDSDRVKEVVEMLLGR